MAESKEGSRDTDTLMTHYADTLMADSKEDSTDTRMTEGNRGNGGARVAEGNGGNGDARRIGSVCARGFKIKLRLRVGGPACDPEDEACVKESRELPVKEIEKDCVKSGWDTSQQWAREPDGDSFCYDELMIANRKGWKDKTPGESTCANDAELLTPVCVCVFVCVCVCVCMAT